MQNTCHIRLGKILDLGCGPGTSARYFRSEDYVGIDISSEYLSDARKCNPATFSTD